MLQTVERELRENWAPETNTLLSLSGSVSVSADGSWSAKGWKLVTMHILLNFQNESNSL
jgi:hypothetical protein